MKATKFRICSNLSKGRSKISLNSPRYLLSSLERSHKKCSKINYKNILGKSDSYEKVLQQVDQVAPTDTTVLITGESGTGKEMAAMAEIRIPLPSQAHVETL